MIGLPVKIKNGYGKLIARCGITINNHNFITKIVKTVAKCDVTSLVKIKN